MKKTPNSVPSDWESDDMYTGDKVRVVKEPSVKRSCKDTGNSSKGQKSDSEKAENHQKEKILQDRIKSLEEEVIKLQLQNNLLTAAAPIS